MIKIKDVYNYLTTLYPLENASTFDQGKVGLQFGSMEDEVKKVIICLDTTNDVIDEAIKNGANLIISHHPFMFSPLLNLNYESNFGKKLLKIFNNRINMMAFHTNFDVAIDGMNDALANILNLEDIQMTTLEHGSESFVRVGKCSESTLKEYSEKVKKAFNQDLVRVAGNLDKKVSKVAIVGGSGSSCYYDAFKCGADVFITGQLPHHLALEALENNFALIEVSHGIEFMGVNTICEKLKNKFSTIEFIITLCNMDPFVVL